MSYNSLFFLYQKKDTILKNTKQKQEILNIYYFIIKSMINALERFYLSQSYEEFDPHVGDTGCQIRAVFMLDIFYKNILDVVKTSRDILNALYDLKNRISTKINFYAHGGFERTNQITIEDFFKSNNLIICVDLNCVFLTVSWLLGKYKIKLNDWDSVIDIFALFNDASFSKKTAKKLINNYQNILANISTQFILLLIKKERNINFYIQSKQLCLYDEFNRPVLPCFLQFDILLSYIAYYAYPILLLIKQEENSHVETHYFYFNASKKKYLLKRFPTKIELESPCFIVSGKTKFHHVNDLDLAEKIEQIDILSIIKMNAATHPQYSGKKLSMYNENTFSQNESSTSIFKELAYDFKRLKSEALYLGCCQQQFSLFLLKHIFCDFAVKYYIYPSKVSALQN